MQRALTTLLLLLLFVPSSLAASPVKARTLSGIGILLISEKPPKSAIYKEPHIGRISELNPAALPGIAFSTPPPQGFTAAIVTSKKGNWFRIIFDDGEREGWLEGRSSYQFYKWDELLRNRRVNLVGGLKKDYYQLRKEPDFSALPLETLSKGSSISALLTEGEWIKVLTGSQAQGWIRWRDDNGRLTIAPGF